MTEVGAPDGPYQRQQKQKRKQTNRLFDINPCRDVTVGLVLRGPGGIGTSSKLSRKEGVLLRVPLQNLFPSSAWQYYTCVATGIETNDINERILYDLVEDGMIYAYAIVQVYYPNDKKSFFLFCTLCPQRISVPALLRARHLVAMPYTTAMQHFPLSYNAPIICPRAFRISYIATDGGFGMLLKDGTVDERASWTEEEEGDAIPEDGDIIKLIHHCLDIRLDPQTIWHTRDQANQLVRVDVDPTQILYSGRDCSRCNRCKLCQRWRDKRRNKLARCSRHIVCRHTRSQTSTQHVNHISVVQPMD